MSVDVPDATFDVTYDYDNLSRLTGWESWQDSLTRTKLRFHTYHYDGVGNRDWLDSDTNKLTYYDAHLVWDPSTEDVGWDGSPVASDLIRIDPLYYFGKPENGVVNGGFDSNGNLVLRYDQSDPNSYWQYTYDYENRLVRADRYENNGSTATVSVTYTHDVLGNLVKRDAGGAVTTYTVDVTAALPVVLVENTTISGSTTTTKYTYGGDLLKANRSNDPGGDNGDFYYFYDALGSVRTITDSQGTVKCRYVYDPYGQMLVAGQNEQPLSVEDQAWNKFLYTGQAYDRTTEFVYLRARWYDTDTGRFLSRDSLEGKLRDPSSLHRYAYCSGDPINRRDPSGEWSVAATVAAIGVAVALVAVVEYARPGTVRSMLGVPEFIAQRIIDLVLANYDGPTVYGAMDAVADQWETYDLSVSEWSSEIPSTYRAGGKVTREFARKYFSALAVAAIQFGSARLLHEHYYDHGAELGYGTEEEYLTGAQKFFSKPPTRTTMVGWRGEEFGPECGDFVRYDKATGEFGIMSKDGIIRSYMKRDKNGMQYFMQNVTWNMVCE